MNKKYCIGSLYNSIELLERFISQCDYNDEIYLLGNFSINTMQQQSQITYIYLYNLIEQKALNKESNLPQLILIRGKNEDQQNFNKKFFNELSITSAYKFIKNMELSSLFDFNQKYPTSEDINQFVNSLPFIIELDHFILVSGYFNPLKTIEEQIKEIYDNPDYGLIYGSPGRITEQYYKFCKQHKLRLWTKSSIEKYNASKNNYLGFKTIDEYNELLIEKTNKIVVCGNWYDPIFKKDLNIKNWSHLWMIDGGLGRSLNNEDQWFYFDKDKEQFNVIDITNENEIKIISFN